MGGTGDHLDIGDGSDFGWFEVEAEHCRRIAANSDYSPEGRRAFEDLGRFYEALAEQEKDLGSCARSRLARKRYRVR